MTCPPGSKAESLGISRPYVLSGLKEAIRGHFEVIRSTPTPLYDKLAAALRPGDAVITFNYDLAIEKALRVGGKWDISTGYDFAVGPPQETAVPVLKLHGSINWRGLLFGGISHGFSAFQNSLGERPVLFFKPDLTYLGYNAFVDPLCAGLNSAATLPAMILPALPKQFFFDTNFGPEWGAFWEGLWNHAEQLLQSADEVAIIGYSLPVADERARQLILQSTNKLARLAVCCRENTSDIERLFRTHGFANIVEGTPTFEDFLAEN
jgi:hypothetical protein